MASNNGSDNPDDGVEEQRPRQQSLGGVLKREGNWRCLLLSALLAGCLAAAIWCRLAQVQKVVINFSVYPIKRTRQMSPCDDGYIYIPVAFMGLLYLVYLVECYHCTARLQLAHRVDVNTVADHVRAMRLAKPKVWWKAVCYHYVRRKRQVTRYRNGDSYTTTQVYYERVNSYSASATFAHAYCGFKDVSRNLILDSCGPITKIRFSKGFAFSNIEAASEFEDQRSRFFAEHERFDDCMEMREGLDLIGVSSFKEYMVAYRDTESLPWYSSHALFWVLSCLLLSWPLRILIECNTSYVHYTVTKIFGVNYDIENTRRSEMENGISQYSPAMHCTRRPQQPHPEPVLNTQTAILANGISSNSSSMQHINILALARSRNNLEQAAMMSHTSTIDSLELFATIRENCALVPSYSEALLLSSIDNNPTGTSGGSPRSNFSNRRKSLDPNQRIAPSTSSSVNQESETHQSAIITTPRRKLRIVTEEDHGNACSSTADSDEDEDDLEATPYRIHTTQSNYSLKTNNNYILIERDKNSIPYKFQNRKSWAGFLSKPNQSRHGSARIRPIPLLSCRKNSLTDSLLNDNNSATTSNENRETERRISTNVTSDVEMAIENELPISQIEAIDRNLMEDEVQDEQNKNLYFASPLMKFCPEDPFGGRTQTTPTEDPPPYEVAVNLPVLRRITRSVTDRGELFGQSRAFINDTLLNRRSCVDNVVSGTDAVRLLDNTLSNREKVNADAETNL